MRSRTAITVAAAGFEDLVRLGLQALVEADEHLELLAADLPLDRLALFLEDLRPTVLLLNVEALDSAADVHRLHGAMPDVRLVLLADRPTPAESNQLLALGASACLGKAVQARDIRNAIHLASRGLQVVPQGASNGGAPATQAGPELLTPREADVLQLLRQGRSNAEIAQALTVSVETVRTHRRNIYRKLGVRTRRELAALGQHR
ncbi:response regulator transcription factor [Conexibacter sp. SYSU D00693]|uniref:helix-turn-helix transcriptional regulator n=1 Tax=Conexibacter sp. SYSU D00693 TaxID=2812560 RepID=UPI00196B9FAD|nr:response regulator transcription factor [Conexibacter sp. SYSU D00693]